MIVKPTGYESFIYTVLALLGLIMFLAVPIWLQYKRYKRLTELGISTMATVIRTHTIHDDSLNGQQNERYYAEVKFLADGKEITSKIKLSSKHYISLQPGQQIEVIYLPESPKKTVTTKTEMEFSGAVLKFLNKKFSKNL